MSLEANASVMLNLPMEILDEPFPMEILDEPFHLRPWEILFYAIFDLPLLCEPFIPFSRR